MLIYSYKYTTQLATKDVTAFVTSSAVNRILEKCYFTCFSYQFCCVGDTCTCKCNCNLSTLYVAGRR